jgi:hypothetical protein
MIALPFRWWAIRHKPSGLWLPEPVGRADRGGSHVEPSAERPRVWPTPRGAQNALSAWLRGKFEARRGADGGGPGWDPEYYEDIEVVPQPHRRRADMEVVELTLCWEATDAIA